LKQVVFESGLPIGFVPPNSHFSGDLMPTASEQQTLEELRQEVQRLREEQQRFRNELKQNGDAPNRNQSAGDDPRPGEQSRQDKDLGESPQQQPPKQQPPQQQPPQQQPPRQQPPQQPAKPDQAKQDAAEKQEKGKDEPPKPPLRERTRNWIAQHPIATLLGAVALVALIVGGIFYWRYIESYESTDDAQVDGHLNPISSRVEGTVSGVYVEDDQFVKAGQDLVDLDPRDLRMALEQAQGAYAQSQAQLQAANPNVPITQTTNQTSISTTQSDVLTADAAVAAAQQDYQARVAALEGAQAQNLKAQADVTRYALLVQRDEISRQQYDAAVATAKSQTASVEAARADVEASRKMVDQRRAQLDQARSRLAETENNAPRQIAIRKADIATREAAGMSAKAELEQARLNLSYTKILAPADGVVTNKTVEVGQRIQPGEELLSVSQVDDIWVTANFKETQLKRMRPGQSVDIHVDAFGITYKGYVEGMPGASGARTSLLPPENATGNFVKVVQRLPVRIRLKPGEDPQHRLRIGMSVEPTVWLNSNPD
jgi:membrane fusion protein, multidrug efflux system